MAIRIVMGYRRLLFVFHCARKHNSILYGAKIPSLKLRYISSEYREKVVESQVLEHLVLLEIKFYVKHPSFMSWV